MTTVRERINAHLPIALQLLSTLSLVVIALSAICCSQSLKELSESHDMGGSVGVDKIHNH